MPQPTSVPPLARRAHLGLQVLPRREHDLGLRVHAVEPDATGEKAGIVAADQLVSFGATTLATIAELQSAIAATRAGDKVALRVYRGGEALTFEATMQPVPLEHPHIELGEVPGANGARLRTIVSPADPNAVDATVSSSLAASSSVTASPAAVLYLAGSDWTSCDYPFVAQHPVRRLVEALTRHGLTVWRLERSGTGDSEGPPCTDTDFAQELVGLRAVLDAMLAKHDRVILLGNSLGGMQAPLLACAYGSQLAGVAVIGTTAASWHECTLASYRRQLENDPNVAVDAIDDEVARLESVQAPVLLERLSPELLYQRLPKLEGHFRHYAGSRIYGRQATFFQQLQALDLRDAWSKVSVPVLALHGSLDRICTKDDAREIADLAPLGTHHELPAVDHGMTGEADEAIAQAITTWLSPL